MSADFLISLNKALFNEGFISDNPRDNGGFTYKGISRVKNPSWPGWKIIDSILPSLPIQKPGTELVEVLNSNAALQNQIKDFYRTGYWNKIQGDRLPSQLIADEMFNNSINLGVAVASEFMQNTINFSTETETYIRISPLTVSSVTKHLQR